MTIGISLSGYVMNAVKQTLVVARSTVSINAQEPRFLNNDLAKALLVFLNATSTTGR